VLAHEPAVREDAELRSIVDDIVVAGRRMDDLIGQVLAYGQEGGQLALSDVAIDEVFRRAVDDISPFIQARGAVVELEQLPVVRCDAGLLHSVALNLLTNAVKFARPGVPPRVCVTAEEHDDRVRVAVRDNGIGVPTEQAGAVFDLFVRGTSDAEGHGIGLATAKRVVEAHGGRVGIEPTDGPGTTVWFELPA